MPSSSLRESEGRQLAFRPNIWDKQPADSRCQCTWAPAPGMSPYGSRAPWGLKFKNLLCVHPHNNHYKEVIGDAN
jgi:hypothetical protein